MTAEQLDEKAIFERASALPARESRRRYVERACDNRHELAARVIRLLELHEASPSFLEVPALMLTAATPTSGVSEPPGTQIGPYTLVRQIGEGGMGAVYRAEQTEPVRRSVAVKVIKPGLDTREVVARFEAERQALALMSHPHVAKVLDAGATASGRPYFVMELVNGLPITEFCDRHRYDTRQRLELFVSVCRAVQHAHQKGLIHRDLKPSNVLVELHDAVAVPKVIDFGVAKAVNASQGDRTQLTGCSQVIGTPLYMSPEQAGLTSMDVDTRSDIYSLGVLLYELLTGTTPFDRDMLQRVDWDELRRVIREAEPPRPSQRVSTLEAAEQSTVAEHRHVDIRRLGYELRGELDWIVMKALAKDRTRRYETANGLARDLERFLSDQPVEARPPSKLYRVTKFVRRNKIPVLAASAVFVSLAAALVGMTIAAISQSKVTERERQLALQATRIHGAITEALGEVARVRGIAPREDSNNDADLLAVHQRLRLAVRLADNAEHDSQQLAVALRVQRELKEELAERAQHRQDRELLDAFERAWRIQANVDVTNSRFSKEDAVPLLREALERYGIQSAKTEPRQVAARIETRPPKVREQIIVALDELLRLSPPGIGITLRHQDGAKVIARILPGTSAARDGGLQVGDQLVGIGQGEEGPIVDTTVLERGEVRRLLRGESGTYVRLKVMPVGEREPRIHTLLRDPTAAWCRAVLERADDDSWRARLRQATAIADPSEKLEALEEMCRQVEVDQQPVRVLTRLANELLSLEAKTLAIALLRRTQSQHPDDLWANATLAEALMRSRPPQFEEAVRYYTAAIALRPNSAGFHVNLGSALQYLHRTDDAIAAYREGLRIVPSHAAPRRALVNILIKAGQLDESEALAREGVERWPTAASYSTLGCVLMSRDKHQEGLAAYREALRLDRTSTGAQGEMAIDLFQRGRSEEGLALLREIAKSQPTSPQAHFNLAWALKDVMGRTEQALHEYRASLELNPYNVAALVNLTELLHEQRKPHEAVAACREVLAQWPDSAETYNLLGLCHTWCGEHQKALAAYRESIRLYPYRMNFRAFANAARMLAEADDPAVRDVAQAIDYATKSIAFAPEADVAWSSLGIARFHNGDWRESVEAFQEAENHDSAYVDGSYFITTVDGWATDRFYRAMAHWHLGEREEARNWFLVGEAILPRSGLDRGEELHREAAELLGVSLAEARGPLELAAAYLATLESHSESALRRQELAWLLVSSPDPEVRSPETAVDHALLAVQQAPKLPDAWIALGAAYYRLGQWEKAVEALEHIKRPTGPMQLEALFLAMAYWQLDRKDEARDLYDRAATLPVEYTDEDLLRRCFAEAEKLLEGTAASEAAGT